MSLKKVIEEINKNRRFIITSHINLEGDALGSQLAMRDLILYLKKTAVIVCEDKVPGEYRFLPGLKYLKRPRDITDFNFDVLIALDCSDIGRCRKAIRLFPKNRTIINIDHHISNSKFGDVNWVDPRSSSTVEMIYKLYKKMHVPLDRNKALWLYTGIITDTGSFRYPNTTADSHRIASRVLKYNLAVNKIYKNIYENLSFSDMKLLSKILLTLRRDPSGKIVWFEIKRKFLNRKRASFDLSEQVLNFGRLNKQAEVIVLFREDPGSPNQIHVNFRSKDEVDVNMIAKVFEGGGHKNASGCTVKGELPGVEKIVLKELKDYLR